MIQVEKNIFHLPVIFLMQHQILKKPILDFVWWNFPSLKNIIHLNQIGLNYLWHHWKIHESCKDKNIARRECHCRQNYIKVIVNDQNHFHSQRVVVNRWKVDEHAWLQLLFEDGVDGVQQRIQNYHCRICHVSNFDCEPDDAGVPFTQFVMFTLRMLVFQINSFDVVNHSGERLQMSHKNEFENDLEFVD